MLKQASVSDLITGRVSRGRKSYVVISMRRYPRFINRELRDEYQPSLAADRKLFEAWLSTKRRTGDHNGSFFKVRFEERFKLDEDGLRAIERLTRLSRKKDVYLVCQCASGLRCHREMVLLLARELFGARIEEPSHAYETFLQHLRTLAPKVMAAPLHQGEHGAKRSSASGGRRSLEPASRAPRRDHRSLGSTAPKGSARGEKPSRSSASR